VRKINNADCIAGNPDNGIMALLKYMVFVLKNEKNEKFIIKRDKKYGGDLEYSSYKEVERDFVKKKLHPLDLKNAVAQEINLLLRNFRRDKKLHELYNKAY